VRRYYKRIRDIRRFRNVLFLRTRGRPPEGIISGTEIVSQFRDPHRRVNLASRASSKIRPFVNEVVVAVDVIRPILFPSLRQKGFESPRPSRPIRLAASGQRAARNALRNFKNLFSADRAHALLFDWCSARAMPRIFVHVAHIGERNARHYYRSLA